MEENDIFEKISERFRPYSTTMWNGGNGNTYISLQKSIMKKRRDQEGKLILSKDGKSIETGWDNRNIYFRDLKDLKTCKQCIDETIEKLENNEV